jgi:hypothetical protein
MITVDWRRLGLTDDTEPLATGAVGAIYRVVNPVPGLPWPLAYKQVLPEATPSKQQALAQMRKVVAMRDIMSDDELAELDEVTVWPRAMVQAGGKDVGVLMSFISDDFFIRSHPSGGQPGRKVFELQFLCASDNYLQKQGIDRSSADHDLVRLALVARLAYAVEVVHRRPRVYGDLHLMNVAVATTETARSGRRKPKPQALLMDCDGVADLSDPRRQQLHGLGFLPPELKGNPKGPQDQQTDVYKLGLCVIRGLARGRGATQCNDPTKTIPGLLDAEGVDLLHRAVGTDRSRRPTAAELKEYLVARVARLAPGLPVPQLVSAELSRNVALRGSDTVVRWKHRNGHRVRIHGVNGFEVDNIDPDAHPHGYAVQPPTAGPIYVEVRDEQGMTDELFAGHLDYYELPAFEVGSQLRGLMPRLALPDLPEVEVPRAHADLPPYPVFTAGTAPAPPPSVADYVDLGRLAPNTSGVDSPRADIERAYHAANLDVAAALGDGAQRLAAAVREALEHRGLAAAVTADLARELGGQPPGPSTSHHHP